ncbi:hypothetical protein PP178_13565 [Zeaxanthinibacter sp. PT1]|nr:hypothetical protein [Zeaxanthinibacter sp. PT1]MDC6352584.1 hypothetical protein [Zeaxanthinibacter sp. PT1]
MLIIYVILLLCSILAFAGCTNDEGSKDLDVITPADSTMGIAMNFELRP